MASESTIIIEKLDKLAKDVELIKEFVLPEGELTDWAKKELEEARKRPHSEYISLEEVKKKILAKK